MPEVEYTTTLSISREDVWTFVKDMNNWAPFLTGYQRHEILSETDSIWTLKGDVGVLARIVRLKAHVTDWSGPDRVAFTLTGLNEAVEGEELVMRRGRRRSAAQGDRAALVLASRRSTPSRASSIAWSMVAAPYAPSQRRFARAWTGIALRSPSGWRPAARRDRS